MNKGIVEIHNDLINDKVTSKELVKKSLDLAHSCQEKTNSFVTIIEDAKEEKVTDELLSGIPCGVKDIFSTKDILSTGSSNTLRDYVPFFDATCVKKLKEKYAEKNFITSNKR